MSRKTTGCTAVNQISWRLAGGVFDGKVWWAGSFLQGLGWTSPPNGEDPLSQVCVEETSTRESWPRVVGLLLGLRGTEEGGQLS